MKHFIKKMIVFIVLTIISLSGGICFLLWGINVVAFTGFVFFFGCILAVIFEIRDYQFYKDLSVKMQGKTLDEKLKIIDYHEECWLSYATAEEVKQFRDEAEKHPDNHFLDYLLERAAMYNK